MKPRLDYFYEPGDPANKRAWNKAVTKSRKFLPAKNGFNILQEVNSIIDPVCSSMRRYIIARRSPRQTIFCLKAYARDEKIPHRRARLHASWKIKDHAENRRERERERERELVIIGGRSLSLCRVEPAQKLQGGQSRKIRLLCARRSCYARRKMAREEKNVHCCLSGDEQDLTAR